MAVDLSVFRKQRKMMEKKAKKKSKDTAMPKVSSMREEKVIERIGELENKLMEDMIMKKNIEKEMKQTRQIMYIVLAVTLAIFAFLIGVLARYIG
jgi:hypothetical protein